MDEMELIAEIFNHMDDTDKAIFTLRDAEDMVADQMRMDRQHGRKPVDYDPQFFFDTICELIAQGD